MAQHKRKPTDTVQVPVRMQERLRADLEKAAKKRGEKTSLNSEIVRRLEESFDQETARELLSQAQRILEEVNAITPEQAAAVIKRRDDAS
jgi:hypothetical protein